MCYHWDLGVGHLHVHCPVSTSNSGSGVPDQPKDIEDDQNGDCKPDNVSEDASNIDCISSDAYDSDKSEWGLGDRNLEGWGDEETDGDSDIPCRSQHDSESEDSDEDSG
jgi:hypothetical protein